MFGLTPLTTFFVFVTPVIGVILALIFGATFRVDTDEWFTIDNMFKK